MALGEHTFTLTAGTKTIENVVAADGWPGITIPTIEGRKWVAMKPQQLRKTLNKDGTWRWWGNWRVQDHPEIPRHLRGAVVHIRHSHSADDGDRSRSRATRLHPESSQVYNLNYRLRNDVESMHRHLKDHMFNDRVSTMGDRNLRIWTHSYQTRVNRHALIAWHHRTGGDISPWFGNWLPPPQHRTPTAA
jgi:hypothetical protein